MYKADDKLPDLEILYNQIKDYPSEYKAIEYMKKKYHIGVTTAYRWIEYVEDKFEVELFECNPRKAKVTVQIPHDVIIRICNRHYSQASAATEIVKRYNIARVTAENKIREARKETGIIKPFKKLRV